MSSEVDAVIRPIEDFLAPGEAEPSYWDEVLARALATYDPPAADLSRGFTLYFRPREYRFARTISLTRSMGLLGAGGGVYRHGTRLQFGTGPGVLIPFEVDDSAPDAPASSGTCGQGTVIERLGIVGPGRTTGSHHDHGVVVNARCKIRNVTVADFAGDGIHVEGSAHTRPVATNANVWQIEQVMVTGCGRHGVFVHGPDANVGCAVGVDVTNVNGWAIRDESQLGCTWVACHVDQSSRPAPAPDIPMHSQDSSGTYFCQYPPARVAGSSLFLGCYLEGTGAADPASPNRAFVQFPALVVGGALALGYLGGAGGLGMGGYVVNAVNGLWAQGRSTTLGGSTTRGSIQVGGAAILSLWPGQREAAGQYTLEYGRMAPGWWSLVLERLSHVGPLAFSDDTAIEGGRRLWFPMGYFLGTGHARTYVSAQDGSARPDRPARAGERVVNARPRPGEYEGWVGMADGTWRGFGLVERLPGDI